MSTSKKRTKMHIILIGIKFLNMKKLPHPTKPAEDVVRTTKDLQERTQLIERDDGET